jgi:acyl-CoA dehydrogenase
VTAVAGAPAADPGLAHLEWPFFDDAHRELARGIRDWAAREFAELPDESDVDAACRSLARRLGEAGWLRHALPAPYGGASERVGARSLCVLREALARASALADFAFAMQGLGTGPISLYGSEALKRRYLPGVAAGERLAAFAISEAEAGSDVGAMRTTARRDGTGWMLDGEKTWISNAGIADHYVVFARLADGTDAHTDPVRGAAAEPPSRRDSYVALVAEADDPGVRVTARIALAAPHPLGTVRFDGCRLPAERLVGEAGRGLRVALGTLDLFRPTVGAAALGLARRAMDEASAWVRRRTVFGRPLAEHQMTQGKLADMAVRIDASALLVYRAAWARDRGERRTTRESAMAKLYATESAQRVIDDAVQLLGARGVQLGHPVERLYREVRALRIYEGTSEIQRLVIAEHVLRDER